MSGLEKLIFKFKFLYKNLDNKKIRFFTKISCIIIIYSCIIILAGSTECIQAEQLGPKHVVSVYDRSALYIILVVILCILGTIMAALYILSYVYMPIIIVLYCFIRLNIST